MNAARIALGAVMSFLVLLPRGLSSRKIFKTVTEMTQEESVALSFVVLIVFFTVREFVGRRMGARGYVVELMLLPASVALGCNLAKVFMAGPLNGWAAWQVQLVCVAGFVGLQAVESMALAELPMVLAWIRRKIR